jgi:hypothetical protein
MEEVKPGFEKWVIIPIAADSLATVNIDFRIPGNVRHCKGVACSVYEVTGVFSPDIFMGELSLSFNNRKSQPVNFVTEYRTDRFQINSMVIKLEEPVEGGSRISGYYRSLIALPQRLNIYLQCIIDSY